MLDRYSEGTDSPPGLPGHHRQRPPNVRRTGYVRITHTHTHRETDRRPNRLDMAHQMRGRRDQVVEEEEEEEDKEGISVMMLPARKIIIGRGLHLIAHCCVSFLAQDFSLLPRASSRGSCSPFPSVSSLPPCPSGTVGRARGGGGGRGGGRGGNGGGGGLDVVCLAASFFAAGFPPWCARLGEGAPPPAKPVEETRSPDAPVSDLEMSALFLSLLEDAGRTLPQS